ncbi:MAG TPA: phosphatidylglycerophosphatase A [Stellaceae bacterium]|nr:phosphatidylglycerophosphatase A [Stellaceae bacterium]
MPEERSPELAPHHPAGIIATWFGAGLLPWAPGTWGSLAALPFAWVIAWLFGAVGLLAAAIALFFIGWWAAARMTRATGIKDSGTIVVDEVAGQWLSLVAAPLVPGAYALAFVLFRLFDITKPWPARWADRALPGGFGVMADDVFAGIYAALALRALLLIGGWLLG